jgi:uncharacterized protein with NRDE domain
MCTESYIPLTSDQFILTYNRDENVARRTSSPVAELIGDTKVVFPKDMQAGGTWAAAGNNGRICCLLNGAFISHERKTSYSKSRGKLVLEAFEHQNIYDFFNNSNLEDVEPFTIIVLETIDETKLVEFRWNSVCKQVRELDVDRPHFWSSSTLYNFKIREKREAWFKEWIKNSESIDREKILNFHSSTHGDDAANDIVMERENGLRTVSITQIEKSSESFTMNYNDLLKNQRTSLRLEMQQQEYA